MPVNRGLADIMGYLVDRLATPAQNLRARHFWQQVKVEAEKRDPTMIARYRMTSKRLIDCLARLPQAQRDAAEQDLYRQLIQPYGPTLEPKEFEQIAGKLTSVLRASCRKYGGRNSLPERLRQPVADRPSGRPLAERLKAAK